MRRSVSVLLAAVLLLGGVLVAQSAQEAPTGRKATSRVEPVYPELARRMHLQGVVRIAATVRPNGSVKSTHVLGGNPVLAEAAGIAVSKWKFEPGSSETTEVVQVVFAPQ